MVIKIIFFGKKYNEVMKDVFFKIGDKVVDVIFFFFGKVIKFYY